MAVHIQRAELTQFEQRVVQSMVDDNEGDCGPDVIQYGMTLAEFVEHCETLFPTEEKDIRGEEISGESRLRTQWTSAEQCDEHPQACGVRQKTQNEMDGCGLSPIDPTAN